jgi:hypothetical protein
MLALACTSTGPSAPTCTVAPRAAPTVLAAARTTVTTSATRGAVNRSAVPDVAQHRRGQVVEIVQLAHEPLEHGARVAILAAEQRDRLAEHAHRRHAAAQFMSEQRYVVWSNRLIGVPVGHGLRRACRPTCWNHGVAPSCSLWWSTYCGGDPPAHLKN